MDALRWMLTHLITEIKLCSAGILTLLDFFKSPWSVPTDQEMPAAPLKFCKPLHASSWPFICEGRVFATSAWDLRGNRSNWSGNQYFSTRVISISVERKNGLFESSAHTAFKASSFSINLFISFFEQSTISNYFCLKTSTYLIAACVQFLT